MPKTLKEIAKGTFQETSQEEDSQENDSEADVTGDVTSQNAAKLSQSVTGRSRPQLRVSQSHDARLSNLAAQEGRSKAQIVEDLIDRQIRQERRREPQGSELGRRAKSVVMDAMELGLFWQTLQMFGMRPTGPETSANSGANWGQIAEVVKLVSGRNGESEPLIRTLKEFYDGQRGIYEKMLEQQSSRGPTTEENIGKLAIEKAVAKLWEGRPASETSKIDYGEVVKVAGEIFKTLREKIPPKDLRIAAPLGAEPYEAAYDRIESQTENPQPSPGSANTTRLRQGVKRKPTREV
jgi:hypothetical protein